MSQYNDILQRLGIASLNQMQQEAVKTIEAGGSTILLSPTGTGKTLAYLLPLTTLLKADAGHIQAVIIVPARELALQIGSIHNLAFYLWLVGEARKHIVAGDYSSWKNIMIGKVMQRL